MCALHCRRGVNRRSPVVAETSGPRSARFGGAIVMEDGASLSASDEASGSRASYSTDTDSGGEAEYSMAFDNESRPGFTAVGIEGMDQDNLLMDVTLSFYEMGIRYLTETQPVLELMVVFSFLYKIVYVVFHCVVLDFQVFSHHLALPLEVFRTHIFASCTVNSVRLPSDFPRCLCSLYEA